jgi:hypothetical protein
MADEQAGETPPATAEENTGYTVVRRLNEAEKSR